MSVSPINAYSQPISFHGKSNDAKADKKHPIKATMSLVVPGSGQVLNGDFIKSVGYFSVAGTVDAITAGLTVLTLAASKAKTPLLLLGATALSGLMSLGVHISSAKDAYRGGRKA